MPISSSDILIKFSTQAGAAGNSGAGAALTSIGKYISTTQVTDSVDLNLFDVIGAAANAALQVDYRCVFVHNNHATLTWQNVVVWLLSEVAGGANTAIGVDPAAASAIGAGPAAQAAAPVDRFTAPAGVAFSSPTTQGAALSVGNLAPGQCRAVWVRRTATNSAALANDGVTLRVQGESL